MTAVILIAVVLVLVGLACWAGRDPGPPWRGGDGPPGTMGGGL